MATTSTVEPGTGPTSWPAYPLVLALSWVLASMVASGFRLEATLRVLVLVPGVAALITLLALVLLRNRHRAGVASGVLMLLLVSRDFIRLGLAVVGIVAVILLLRLLQRMRRRPVSGLQVTNALNLVSVILLATVVVQGFANGTLPALAGDIVETPPDRGSVGRLDLPDVYVVLLDGYPRADIVEEKLGGDIGPFLAELGSRGFEVDPSARSGYMYTDLAVISMLHGRHLVDIPRLAEVIDGAHLPARGRQVLNAAPLLETLADDGYTLLANAQAWDEPALRRVHRLVEATGLNEFERHFLLESLPGAVWEAVDSKLPQDLMEPWVHDAFDFISLAAETDVDGPRFVFAHVPSPHFPIVFTADGGAADPRFGTDHPDQVSATHEEIVRAYLQQVDFVNRRLLDALDTSPIPEDAMVIVMSDHGPEFGLDWTDGAQSDLETRFATLFAARAPGGVFNDSQSVTGVLVRLLDHLELASLDEPDERFFVTGAFTKYATLAEVESPWSD